MPKEAKQKRCTKCGEVKPLGAFYYHRHRKYFMPDCKECNKAATTVRNRNKVAMGDPRHILRVRAAGIRRDRKTPGITVCEDLGDYLCELWDAQEGKCFYTGEVMTLGMGSYRTNNPVHCSVDRLIPAKGYVRGNLVLACIKVNRVMQDLEFEDFIEFCRLMVSRSDMIREKIRNL